MPDYKSMYFRLFNMISDAIEILQQAQIEGEDTFISNESIPTMELLYLQKDDEKDPPE